jgi:pimeloyl-ACP methyl ester carboxylesterase
MSHLEYDWQSPIWRHTLLELSREHTLVRFDQRSNGLSDWDVDEVSFDAFVNDLAAVVDAAKLERFPLFGISQGCAISVAYAVHHPERVSRLILYGGFARGAEKRGSATARDQAVAMRTLIQHGWGQDNPAFRQMFTSSFLPGGTAEQWDWFNELQRISVSPENAVRLRETNDNVDVTELLDQVTVPTLVMHCRDDGIVPFSEGRRMATMITETEAARKLNTYKNALKDAFRELHVPLELADKMMAISPVEIRILTYDEVKYYGFDGPDPVHETRMLHLGAMREGLTLQEYVEREQLYDIQMAKCFGLPLGDFSSCMVATHRRVYSRRSSSIYKKATNMCGTVGGSRVKFFTNRPDVDYEKWMKQYEQYASCKGKIMRGN